MPEFWKQAVRFGFHLLYNQFAFTYDVVSKAVSLGQWRCWQRAALGFLNATPGDMLLELAFGTGDLQLDLNAADFRVFGHDLSPFMLRLASAKLRRHGVTPRLSRGMAQALPYSSGAFRAVVSTFPAEFILHADTLHEVNRVLVVDGRFVIVPNAVLSGSGAIEAGIEWLYRVTGQRTGPTGEAQQHATIRELLLPYGFDTEVHQVACKKSVATVIVARKIP